MRIPSGKIDQSIYFVAVDASDLKTRLTGLTGFTVRRSRNGGASTAWTTPTIVELSAANMPGVYALLVDEDTTIAESSTSEELCLHISQAAMAPVTRVVELYRPLSVSAGPLVAAREPGNRVSSPIALEMAQFESKGFIIAIVDADGEEVDLEGKTLRFVVHNELDPTASVFEVEAGSIVIDGNVATVSVNETLSSTARANHRWALWDVGAKSRLAWGTFEVKPCIFNHA